MLLNLQNAYVSFTKVGNFRVKLWPIQQLKTQ